MRTKHVFGPVPSRRLGRSLGVDLVPFKTCSFDCIYCQLGRTTNKTLKREEYVPCEGLLEEIGRKLNSAPTPDYITLSGSGEPTLYSRLRELISGIRKLTDVPVAVLTNGSLLSDPEVREDLLEANLVIPSLDAGNNRIFQYVNRPHFNLSFEKMTSGIVEFRKSFTNDLWLEVFLLAGVTTVESEIRQVALVAGNIEADRVQLNTVARPPVQQFAVAVPQRQMEKLATYFEGRVEIIAKYQAATRADNWDTDHDVILGLLSRRPCTLEDVADGLGMHRNEATKQLGTLMAGGAATCRYLQGVPFYEVSQREAKHS